VAEYGACYCALYVRKDLFEGKTPITPVPERRPREKQARAFETTAEATEGSSETSVAVDKEGPQVEMKFWYCKQCGYVVFREDPPYVCPICKAKREMFAELRMRVDTY